MALFPMVILTMTIERMCILWEERGSSEALTAGLGSLLAAALAFLFMNIKSVEHLIFVFPELLLVLLAANILLGTVFRLSAYGFDAIQSPGSRLNAMFTILRNLRQRGVMGINRRNAQYVLKYNPRRLYPLVDDKLRTKELALENGIAVPELYWAIEVEGQVHKLPEVLQDRRDFVVKPAHGSGGEGILVINGSVNNRLRKADGRLLTWDELNHHIFSVLSGLYSLGGQPDKALIEYRVEFDPLFEHITYQGVPDIRIIVFLGVPAMSMIRLPTRISDGKANLHQGAVGVGVDIATGQTLAGVMENEIVSQHPDTGNVLAGLTIPNWYDLLVIAARCYELTRLGYLGVDIVLDKDLGPLILELNARPGLNIQIANNAGLLSRLELVEKHHAALESVEQRVAFAREHFRVAEH